MLLRLNPGHRSLKRALLVGTATFFSVPAYAACDVTGGTATTFNCSATGVNVLVQSGTDVTLDVTDMTIEGADNSTGYITFHNNDGVPANLTLNVTNTSIDSPAYLGVYAATGDLGSTAAPGDLTLTIDEASSITAWDAGIYARTYDGGEAKVTNYADIVAGTVGETMEFGGVGISVTADAGSATLNNYGNVTSHTGRGLYVDGGYVSGADLVSLYNEGDVNGYGDALRAIAGGTFGTDAEVVNYGTVIGQDRRGIVAWSNSGDTSIENHGDVTSYGGQAIYGMANAGKVTITNDAKLRVYDGEPLDVDADDTSFAGIEAEVDGTGDVSVANLAGGDIESYDNGIFAHTGSGKVTVSNDGLIVSGKSGVLAASGSGDISIENSGNIFADGDGHGAGAVAVSGIVGGTVEINNKAGGVIAANAELGATPTNEWLDGASLGELADLAADTASHVAVSAYVDEADSMTATNDGTVVGTIQLGGPEQEDLGTTLFHNNGLWVTNGISALEGSDGALLRNSGTIWALGATEFWSDFANQGGLVVVAATADQQASLSVDGDYDATGNSRLAFDLGAGATLGVNPIVAIAGDVTGRTDLILKDISGWDWKSGGWLDLVTVDGATEFGEESFLLSRPVQGLIEFQLAYEDNTQTWSVGQAEVSEQSIGEINNVASATQSVVASTLGDILNRTDDLRNEFWSDTPVTPLGYTEAPRTVADEAFAALAPVPSQVGTWIKASGAYGAGDGYDSRLGVVDLGADVGTTLDGTFVALGAFGSLSTARVDFETSDSSADIAGTAAGVYGTLMTPEGYYVSGTAMVEASGIDLLLSGETAEIDALTTGARLDVGYRTEVAGFGFEPGAGVRVGATQYSDFTMSSSDVSLSDTSSLAAEMRLRLDRQLTLDNVLLTPFAVFTLGAKADDEGSSVAVSDLGTYEMAGDGGGYAGVAAGMSVTGFDGALTGYARGDLTFTEDAYQAGLKLGASYRF